MLERWSSMLDHIRGIHSEDDGDGGSWGDRHSFKRCLHGELDPDLPYLRKGEEAWDNLRHLLEDSDHQNAIRKLAACKFTSELTTFVTSMKKICPRR